jgi:hypothetical protein
MPTIPYDASPGSLFSPGDMPTLFQAGQDFTPTQLAVEAARLAYVGVENSTAEARRLTQSLASAGFEAAQVFFDAPTGAQAFGAYRASDKMALVAFRGTRPNELKDILGDAEISLVRWSGKGRVHSGFAKRAMALMPKIRDWLAAEAPRRETLLLTGHSLGAAIAVVCASGLQATQVITLGSPQVGNREFAASLQGVDCLRLFNCVDLVTFLPFPIDTAHYTQIGRRLYVTGDGAAVESADDSLVAEDRVKASLGYRLSHPAALLPRTLADHAPINYIRAFF